MAIVCRNRISETARFMFLGLGVSWAAVQAAGESRPGLVKVRLLNGKVTRDAGRKGRDYVRLSDLRAALHLDSVVDVVTRVIELRGPNVRVLLCPAIAKAMLNNEYVQLAYPVVYYDGNVLVPWELVSMVRSASSRATSERTSLSVPTIAVERRKRRPTILIDAGHGGKDPGAIGKGGLQEKEVVLDIARKLKSLIELKGWRVVMTRSNDRFVELGRRTNICRREQPDVFVSIHVNASTRRTARGYEVHCSATTLSLGMKEPQAPKLGDLKKRFKRTGTVVSRGAEKFVYRLYFQEFHDEGRRLAQAIQNALHSTFPNVPDRGVKAGRLFVVRWSQAPAVLVELGFISNRGTEALLRSSEHKAKLAQAVMDGIETYLGAEQE